MDRFINLYILFFLILGNILFGLLNRKFASEDTPIIKKDKSYKVLHAIRFSLLLVWAVAFFLAELNQLKLLPQAEPTRTYIRILGLILFTLGGLWILWARWTLGKWFSTKFAVKKGHQIIKSGPYKIVRHPIYLGVTLAIWGATLALNSLIILIILAIPFPLTLYLNIKAEEKLLSKEMAGEYQKYQQEVPRLIPFLKTKN
ncbi:MAG TPA: isoprenylcysteine carboxylmethyltransferase family protein [candidate division Zixibacteria bacterium]|nr:isoprenylcysteine carboxylmethyltransferase family protein [candidate division Zixibacteria bacterium]